VVTLRRGATKLGCLVYVLVLSAVLYFGVHAGEVYFRYLEYKDAMKQEVRFRTHLTDQQLKTHLKTIADSLGLPEDAGDVNVIRRSGQITIEARYTDIIDLPFMKREVHFEPRATGTY
jgi:hypothetical protein